MQLELLDRTRWRTRTELANALFEYLEIFRNLQRRNSALGMPTPVEFEIKHHTTTAAAEESRNRTPGNPGQAESL